MNPVVEAFAELFKPYAEAAVAAKDEEGRVSYSVREKARQDLNDWANQSINAIFSKALGIYSGVQMHVTEEVVKAPGDTIQYTTTLKDEINALPALQPDWSFTVPQPKEPVKRFRKRKN